MDEQIKEDRFIILRADILTRKDLSASEKLVYARICGFKKYFESKEECAEMLGISKDTIIKAKQKLTALGYIKVLANTGRGKIYQSVYDDRERVVKSTTQSGKKHPVRLVESTTIEEREIKKRVKSDTNKLVSGETPEYGKSEINELFDYFKEKTDIEITSKQQMNRNACNNLIKKYQVEGVRRLIDGVAEAQKDQYAPRISNFIQLQSKLGDLLYWGKLKSKQNERALVI